ncbi:hypothetical protein BCR42DRAFT_408183 [Absidia repens]|uniref:Uncharacterized protein n=1 Tax=Absidia repens TaxID=90262 RepID=A0A1X2IPH7_9FUNG|nr:hypothetical protein BCR42DRAFT_408183 [Absidia repens]
MTGTHRDSSISTQSSSSSSSLPIQHAEIDQPGSNDRSSHLSSQQEQQQQEQQQQQQQQQIQQIQQKHKQHQHQQHDTPRSKRFSQKLVDAAKKQPLARAASTTASLSPPLESCTIDDDDDDELMTDIDSSSFTSPNRDDQDMNNHFQNLLLSSPLRPDLTAMSPIRLNNLSPSTIPDGYSETSSVLNRRKLQDKRPVKHQSISDSPSLSVKPKRRKLKQQRTTSWRMGADVPLDTEKVHLPVDPSQLPTPTPYQQQGNTRRSSRLANRKISYGDNVGIAAHNKKPVVVLGTPGGIKTEYETALVSDDKDHIGCSNSINNNEQQQSQQRPPRKIRRRVDTVEERLDRLIFARDSLDLSQHSVIPTTCNKVPTTYEEPSVVVIDDSGNELDDTSDRQIPIDITKEPNDINENHDADTMEVNNSSSKAESTPDDETLLSKVKLEPLDETMNLSSPSPSTQPPTTAITQLHEPFYARSETDHKSDYNEDKDMMEVDGGQPPLSPTHTPSTATVHNQEEDIDEVVMADQRTTLPIEHSSSQDKPSLDSPSKSLNADNCLSLDTTCISTDYDSGALNTVTTSIQSPLPPAPSSSTSPKLNNPLLFPNDTPEVCSTAHHDTISGIDDDDDNNNHIPPPTSSSAISEITNLSPVTEQTTTNTSKSVDNAHHPSQQAKDIYTFLASNESATTTEGGASMTEDQNSATAPTTETDSSIGSSDGTTLFGRLIGSASHFFLGN